MTGDGTSRIVVPEAALLALLGKRDENLREAESLLAADVHVRGNELTLSGEPADVAFAERVFAELVVLASRGQQIDPDAVRRSVRMLQDDSDDGGDTGPSPAEVLSLDIVSRRGRTVRPKTLNQKRYVDAIDVNTIVFGIGPAGTGKTYLAMAKAVQALQAKQVNRIILTRPAVEAGERLGFLPGTLSEKIDPYLRPLYDALHDMLDAESVPKLMAAGTIEIAPLAYMRGRSLNDAFIILDEAQNTTPEQMKMFLTRLGFNSKMVVTGDVTQVDLPGRLDVGPARRPRHPRRRRRRRVRRADQPGRRAPPPGRRHHRRLRPLRRGPGAAAPPGRLERPAHRAAGGPAQPRAPGTMTAPEHDGTDMSIEIANESGVAVAEGPIVEVARYALDRMGVSPLAELSIMLIELEPMAELHERWLDEPGPTDVMSFPMDEYDSARRPDAPSSGPALLGDIVLCPAFAADQAATAGHGLDDELHLLTVHGVLHLLGYDHAEPDEERTMFGLQAELLADWRTQRAAAARSARERAADDRLLGTVGLGDDAAGGASR